jgi:hypothetical protein
VKANCGGDWQAFYWVRNWLTKFTGNQTILSEPIEVTAKVTFVLQELHVPYFIGGSLASTLYGMVRTTQDSHIVAEMHAQHIQPFVQALQNEFYVHDVHRSPLCVYNRETREPKNLVSRAQENRYDKGRARVCMI